MDQAEGVGEGRARKRRSLAEKRRIVELTFQPGASVALVARAQGVNANQVFAWRRALERGELSKPSAESACLLPISVSPEVSSPSGLIHVELPGHALLSIERGADPTLLRVLLESLRR